MRHFIVFLSFFITQQAFAQTIETLAEHAYLVDMQTQRVLLDKAGDVPMTPSSMSKLMTTYLVFERLREGRIKLTDTLPVSEKAWRMQGSKTFLSIGDEVPLEALIRGIIIQSGNDACIVVAEGLSGSEEAFVQEMNAMAKKLGLTQSHFVNATGWPDEGHVMSARDLAVLAQHIIQDHPEDYNYYAEREYTYGDIHQPNRNRLLERNIGVDGLKTGHTEKAGYGITLSAKQGERRLILVINGLPSDKDRIEEGDKLLRWGFREFTNKTLAKAGAQIGQANVWFGEQPTVGLTSASDAVVTLNAGNAQNVSYTLTYNNPVPAPIEKGAHIADLRVNLPDGAVQTIPLVATEDVEKVSGIKRLWRTLKYKLGS